MRCSRPDRTVKVLHFASGVSRRSLSRHSCDNALLTSIGESRNSGRDLQALYVNE